MVNIYSYLQFYIFTNQKSQEYILVGTTRLELVTFTLSV